MVLGAIMMYKANIEFSNNKQPLLGTLRLLFSEGQVAMVHEDNDGRSKENRAISQEGFYNGKKYPFQR